MNLGHAATIAAALALAGCGEGGGGGGSASVAGTTSTATTTTTTTTATVAPTTTQASRFLGQTSMGATRTAVDTVVSRGYAGWLADQFAMPRATSHWDWLVANGYSAATYINSTAGFDPTMWRQLIVEPDQLRQRVAMALLDMLVVGIDGINLNYKQFAAAAYVDVLLDNAFGTYRQILDAITYNAGMASYVTFLNNRKANATTGAIPDENYARELMQLFTLGPVQLNQDGTVKTAADGTALETYTLTDVSQLARVFTGLQLDSTDSTTPDRYRRPLVLTASLNETGSSTVLGTSISGGGTAAIKTALDAIYAHANLPPFVSKQLIQRLVTSNPSAGYVSRVAATFINNGSGVRGDMKAVVSAIVMDAEARSADALASTSAGRIREPITRLTGWARAYNVSSPSAAWAIGDTSSQSTRLGQAIGRSPTVFGYFRPGYSPPSTSISTLGLVAPEFQVTNEQSVVGYVNYMQGLVANGTGDVKADYTDISTKASDSQALVDEVNLVLANGQLSTATVAAIKAAVDSIAYTATTGATNRVGTAIVLTLASPDYLTFR